MSRSNHNAARIVGRKAKGKRRQHDKLIVEHDESGALVYRPRGRKYAQIEE